MRATRLATVPALLAAGAVVALGATAAPAVAAAAASGAPGPAPYVHGPAGMLGSLGKADFGANVAGYVATIDGTAQHSASGTFVVPKVTCQQRNVSPMFIGIGFSGNEIGPGTAFDYAIGDLTITCTQGVPFYEAAVSTNPERQSGAVSPGDELQVKITTTARKSVVTINDVTSGGVFRVEGSGLEVTSLQASTQGGFTGEKFPKFGAVRFTGIKADGAPLGAFGPTSFDQVNAAGDVLIATVALTVNGLNFRTEYQRQP